MRTSMRVLVGKILFSPADDVGGKPAGGDPPAPAPGAPAVEPEKKAPPPSLIGGAADEPADVGGQPDATDPSKTGTDESADDKSASSVPEKYELALPEGTTLGQPEVDKISAFAREHGLSNEAAQSLLELSHSVVTEREALYSESIRPGGAEWNRLTTEWRDAALADATIGGSEENLKRSASLAKAAILRFWKGDDAKALLTYLDESGVGNHPSVLRGFVNLANATRESRKPVLQGDPPAPPPKTKAQKIYSNLPSEADKQTPGS